MQIPSWISNPSAIDMSRVSGGKNIAVGEAFSHIPLRRAA